MITVYDYRFDDNETVMFIGTFTFTGWSFIGKNSSKLIPIKVLLTQINTNKAPIIGDSILFKQIHVNKAPTNKGKSPYEMYCTDTGVCEKTLLRRRNVLARLAFGAPNQGLESSFCRWTGRPRLGQR